MWAFHGGEAGRGTRSVALGKSLGVALALGITGAASFARAATWSILGGYARNRPVFVEEASTGRALVCTPERCDLYDAQTGASIATPAPPTFTWSAPHVRLPNGDVLLLADAAKPPVAGLRNAGAGTWTTKPVPVTLEQPHLERLGDGRILFTGVDRGSSTIRVYLADQNLAQWTQAASSPPLDRVSWSMRSATSLLTSDHSTAHYWRYQVDADRWTESEVPFQPTDSPSGLPPAPPWAKARFGIAAVGDGRFVAVGPNGLVLLWSGDDHALALAPCDGLKAYLSRFLEMDSPDEPRSLALDYWIGEEQLEGSVSGQRSQNAHLLSSAPTPPSVRLPARHHEEEGSFVERVKEPLLVTCIAVRRLVLGVDRALFGQRGVGIEIDRRCSVEADEQDVHDSIRHHAPFGGSGLRQG